MEKRYCLYIEIKGHTFPYGITQQGQLIPIHNTYIGTTEEVIFNIASSLIGPIRQHEYSPKYNHLLEEIPNIVCSKETSISIYDDGGLVAKYI